MSLSTIDERADNEAKFHNDIATSVDISDIDVERFFNAPTAVENKAILNYFGSLQGKRLLDLGCGYGEASVYFAKHGAQVDAIDISDGMLELAAQLAKGYGVAPSFKRSPAEKLPYEDNSFDFVYGNGVLHHVTLESAIPEIRRVLKPGGKAAFIEPLPYNPAINIYRKMATRYRSQDEQPITRTQRHFVLNAFSSSSHQEFWLSGLAIFGWMYVVQRVHPNQEPYWKKIIYDADQYRFLSRPLLALDRLLTHLPVIRWLAWNTLLLVQK